jgi:PAS domain S-box-containing protein
MMSTPIGEHIKVSLTGSEAPPAQENLKLKMTVPADAMFLALVDQSPAAMCLIDPRQAGVIVLHRNDAFSVLTGYSTAEIVGRDLDVLGGDTDGNDLTWLHQAVSTGERASGEVVIAHKDRSTFRSQLQVSPLHDDAGKLALIVVTFRDATANYGGGRVIARELSHRMKNMFAIIGGIISITGRLRGIEQEAEEINARIYALGRAFETTLDDADTNAIDVGQAIDAILKPYNSGSPRLTITGEAQRVPFATISLLGLVLHELADNARRHGAWADEAGSVHLAWRTDAAAEHLILDWQEETGQPLKPERMPGGTGNLIINRILSRDNGSIERRWDASGLRATMHIAIRRN